MARQKAPPPPMTYREWKDAGCPPLLLSVAHVAEWTNLSIMRVNTYVLNGVLFRYPDGPNKSKIPTDNVDNMQWLLNRDGYVKSDNLSPGRKGRAGARPVPAAPMTATDDGGGIDLEGALEAIKNLDLTKISGPMVQNIARMESALKTRVDRLAKQKQLIDRDLVSTVFNKLYQIDANELRTIGQRVAPGVAAMVGVEDTESQLGIEKLIDGEILKVLAHIRRIMDDFLAGIGTQPIT